MQLESVKNGIYKRSVTDPFALNAIPITPECSPVKDEEEETPYRTDETVKKSDEMKNTYRAARKSIYQNGKLARQNVIDLINTIIRRKHIRITAKHICIDFLLAFLPCKSKRGKKICISKKNIRTQDNFSHAQGMLNRQFDVTKILKMVNLTQLLLSSILSRDEQLLLLY